MSLYDQDLENSRKLAKQAQDKRTGIDDFAGKLNNFIAFLETINYTGSVADVRYFIESAKYYASKIKHV